MRKQLINKEPKQRAVFRLLFGIISLAFAVMISFAACKEPSSGGGTKPKPNPVETFVPVTNITGVATSMTAGTPLTLNGTVEPSNATVKSPIVWTVVADQTTASSSITDGTNILNAMEEGIVVVKASIAGAGANKAEYSRNFTITVNPDNTPPTTGDININIIVINGQGIEVEGWLPVLDKSLGIVNITIQDFDTALWFLNGAHQEPGKTFALDLSGLKEGLNFLTVVVEVNGLEYSKKLDFTVTDEEE